MIKEPEILDVPSKKQNIPTIYVSGKGATPAQKYHRELEELKTKQPYLIRVELETRLNQHFNEVLEAVKNELDRRDESNFELIKQVVREEILISQSPLSEQDDFLNVIRDLRTSFISSPLPNPEMYFKELDSQKLINVLIDDTEEYLKYLDIFSQIVIDIYSKYNLDLEILLFERSEIKIPFNEQGFKKIKMIKDS